MSSKKIKTKHADDMVPVSTDPYPIRTGSEFRKGVKHIRRVVEDFAQVEKRRREAGTLRA